MSDRISPMSTSPNYLELAADIVAAYVSRNSIPTGELPALIGSVHAALQNVASPSRPQADGKATPAVPVKRSVTPDAIISLIDGKPYKSLKRHLAGHGLTPDQYRERYGLPRDYPMVSANYAARRSELAKQAGLGQQRRKAAAEPADRDETESVPANRKAASETESTPAKKGSRKKAA